MGGFGAAEFIILFEHKSSSGTGPSGDGLQLETNDYLLLETGEYFLLG
jgi:hypothetical protein